MSEMWNAVAAAWERNARFVDDHMAAATATMLGVAGIRTGHDVLEVACGPGGAGLAAAARVGPSGRVVLTDVAPAMVEVAARRAEGLDHVSARLSDELGLDAGDASFDAVLCRHGLMFAEPPAAAVREAVRVLRPGGRYVALVWDARAANPWLGCVLDAVGEQFGAPFPPPGVPGPFALDDPALLETALTEGGLTDVAVTRVPTPLRAGSLEAWWELVPELAGPLAQALAAMEHDVREAIHARAVAKAEPLARRVDGGIELDGSALMGSGRRGG